MCIEEMLWVRSRKGQGDAYSVLVKKNKGRRQRTEPKLRWEDNI
jgi:hypothetical protein